jgi:hypothetical protein
VVARYVLADLWRNPRRTLSTMIGVTPGVGLFCGVLFFVDGLSAWMTQRAVAAFDHRRATSRQRSDRYWRRAARDYHPDRPGRIEHRHTYDRQPRRVRRPQQAEFKKAAEEARERADMTQREQAEQVELELNRGSAELAVMVINGSRRPIRHITSEIKSRVDDGSLPAVVTKRYAPRKPEGTGPWLPIPMSGSEFDVLRAGWRAAWEFRLDLHSDSLAVMWFTDDAGLRWQLDEDSIW